MRGDADGALEGAREAGRAHRGRTRKLVDGDARCDARIDSAERLLEKVASEFLGELARSFIPVPVLGEIDAEGLREELGEPRASASATAGFLGERRAGRACKGIVEPGRNGKRASSRAPMPAAEAMRSSAEAPK